ncbi:NAD(P)-dependent oxidoreductase [Mycobacterium sp. LTG2003]
MNQLTAVTVLGLGEMGSALAHALLHHHFTVTVWNRSAAKGDSLRAAGAVLAESPAAAIAASPVTILCVSDYRASMEILGSAGVGAVVHGRNLIQLSTGTPRDAVEAQTWAVSKGASYLDGGILAWPRQMGTPQAALLISGPKTAVDAARPVLNALAGNFSHVGEPIGSASALFAATLSYLAGRWIGFSHGAVICETEGLDVVQFGAMLGDLAPILAEDDRHMGVVVGHGRFGAPESTLRTAGGDIAKLVAHARQAGISSEFPSFASGLFQQAIDAGHGDEEHVALIKVLRQPSSPGSSRTAIS